MAVNFDMNASTPLSPAAVEAMCSFAKESGGNPSSKHVIGQRCGKRVSETKEKIVRLLGGTEADRLVITSGATESNNIVILGIAKLYTEMAIPMVFVSSELEHPSVLNALGAIEREGVHRVVRVPVLESGVVDVGVIETVLDDYIGNVALCSFMTVNHELGTVQPIWEIKKMCDDHQVPLHTDATQAVGKLFPLQLGDYTTFSAHKFNGPTGVGGLLVRAGVDMPKQIVYGGNQEYFVRPGTENLLGIVGMAAALEDHLSHFGG